MSAAPYTAGINAPVARIGQLVATHYGIPAVILFGEGRTQPYAEARQLAMALAHELHGYSLTRLGRAFQRHHSTVLDGVRRTHARRAASAEFDAAYRRLAAALNPVSGA